jgi:hypothetical protein
LDSSGGKMFFCNIQRGVPLKLKNNIQHHNTKAVATD